MEKESLNMTALGSDGSSISVAKGLHQSSRLIHLSGT